MAFKDYREWIAYLEGEGELLRFDKEISPEPDAGAIGRAICDMEAPGAMLEKVSGFDMPLAIGLHASWRRANAALGLPVDTHQREQVFSADDIDVKAKRAEKQTPSVGTDLGSVLEILRVMVALLESNRSDLAGHSVQAATLIKQMCSKINVSRRDSAGRSSSPG